MTGALILETHGYPRRCATESVGFEDGACGSHTHGRGGDEGDHVDIEGTDGEAGYRRVCVPVAV